MLMQKVCFDDAELDLPFCMSLLLWGRTFPQRFLGQTEQSGDRKGRQKREGGRNKERCPLNVYDTQTGACLHCTQ